MALSVDDVVRLTFGMRDARGQQVENTLDVKIVTTGDGGDDGFCDDMVEVATQLYANLNSIMSTTVAFDQVYFYHRTGTLALPPKSWASPPVPTDSAAELPVGTTACVFFRTVFKRRLKRMFLGIFTEASNTGGQIESAAQAVLSDFRDAVLTELNGTNGWHVRPVLWSETIHSSIPLQSGVTPAVWSSQRRRRIGRGS